MKYKTTKLIAKTKHFAKLAGLFQVPEKLLKEVSDYILGMYGYKLGQRIHEKVLALGAREKLYDTTMPLVEKWRNIYWALQEVKRSNKQTHEAAIDDLLQAIGAHEQAEDHSSFAFAGFPYFEPSTMDPVTGLYGIISKKWTGQSLYINIVKENGKYELSLDINFNAKIQEDDEVPTTIKVKIAEDSLTIEELVSILNKEFDNIEKVMIAMERLPYSYGTYERKYINDLAVVYGYCKQLESKLVTTSSSYDFKIKSEDLIYTKGDPNKITYTFYASFIDDIEGTEAIHGVPATGLWESYYSKQVLGSLYVTANTKEDAEKFTDIQQLKEKVGRIRKTVRHEVQHVVQDFIREAKEMKEDAGLPSKKIRDPKYKPSGMPIKEDPSAPEGGRIQHALRDVEFYTRISDEVYKFNAAKRHLPVSMHRDLMLAWVDHISPEAFTDMLHKKFTEMAYKQLNEDPEKYVSMPTRVEYKKQSLMYGANNALKGLWSGRHFFATLKEHQPEKYKKAVSEFIKAIGI